MIDRDDPAILEAARPQLLGLAYRILGSRADAEDAVQDTFLTWQHADRRAVHNPAAWLTTACTRRCLDLLRATHRKRVEYVGAWLPEPVQTPIENDAESRLDFASSLTTAFLLLLERLTPKERAAYLLHDIFDMPYPEISATLDVQEATCRKLVSRAKISIDRARVRQLPPLERQDQLLAAFRAAVTEGSTTPLAELLADDIRLSADSGGRVPAILETLHGRQQVLSFLERLHGYWSGYEWLPAGLNNTRGFVLRTAEATVATVNFAYDEAGKATAIYIVRNPDKLARIGTEAIH